MKAHNRKQQQWAARFMTRKITSMHTNIITQEPTSICEFHKLALACVVLKLKCSKFQITKVRKDLDLQWKLIR
jgi:hypothetical protein